MAWLNIGGRTVFEQKAGSLAACTPAKKPQKRQLPPQQRSTIVAYASSTEVSSPPQPASATPPDANGAANSSEEQQKPDQPPTPARKARKVSLRPASQQEQQLAMKRQKQLEAAVAKAAAIRSRVRRLGTADGPAPGALAGPSALAAPKLSTSTVAGGRLASQSGPAVPAGSASTTGTAAAPGTPRAQAVGTPARQAAAGPGIMKDFANSAADQQLSLLEAKKKSMEILEKIRAKHRKITEIGGPIVNTGPRLVDIRMFEQMAASRNRLSSKLSEANQYAKWLEGQVDDKNSELATCYDSISALALEVGNVSRLAQNAAAAVRYSVDKGEPEEKLMQVSERMQVLQKVMHEKLETLNKAVLREIPVSWYGVATEVRVMGDFDDWTMGVWLSCDSSGQDSSMVTFEGKLYVPPGKYKIKFLVDGEWKPAPNWPVEKDYESGEDNNILVVN